MLTTVKCQQTLNSAIAYEQGHLPSHSRDRLSDRVVLESALQFCGPKYQATDKVVPTWDGLYSFIGYQPALHSTANLGE